MKIDYLKTVDKNSEHSQIRYEVTENMLDKVIEVFRNNDQ